jgi:hypothetical protein
MVIHVVLFRLRDRSAENIAETAAMLRAMKGRIPELLEIEVGVDELHSGRSYDIALRTRHASFEALDAYQVHPVHEEVVAHMKRVLDASVAVDFTG